MGGAGKVENGDAFQGAFRQGVDKRFRFADRATLSLAGKDHQGSTRCITRDCSLAGEKSVTEPEGWTDDDDMVEQSWPGQPGVDTQQSTKAVADQRFASAVDVPARLDHGHHASLKEITEGRRSTCFQSRCRLACGKAIRSAAGRVGKGFGSTWRSG